MKRPRSHAEISPETKALRQAIGRRLAVLREQRHGPRGRSAMAEDLDVTAKNWWNWERGRAMPGEVLLRLLELTGAEPLWVLHGGGPRYRGARPRPWRHEAIRSLRSLIALVDDHA